MIFGPAASIVKRASAANPYGGLPQGSSGHATRTGQYRVNTADGKTHNFANESAARSNAWAPAATTPAQPVAPAPAAAPTPPPPPAAPTPVATPPTPAAPPVPAAAPAAPAGASPTPQPTPALAPPAAAPAPQPAADAPPTEEEIRAQYPNDPAAQADALQRHGLAAPAPAAQPTPAAPAEKMVRMPSGKYIPQSTYDKNREKILGNYAIMRGEGLQDTTPSWGSGFSDNSGMGVLGRLGNVFEAPGVAAGKAWNAGGRGLQSLGNWWDKADVMGNARLARSGAAEGLSTALQAPGRALIGDRGADAASNWLASFFTPKTASEPSRLGAYASASLGGGVGGGLYAGVKRDSAGSGLMAMLLALSAGGGARHLMRRSASRLAHRIEPRLAEELATKTRNVTPGMSSGARRLHSAAPLLGAGAGIAAAGEASYRMAQPPSLIDRAKAKLQF